MTQQQYIIHVKRCQHSCSNAWIDIDSLTIIWNTELSDDIKEEFSQAVGISVLLYGSTTRTLRQNYLGTLHRCHVLFWRNPGSSTLQNSSYKASCFPFHKPYK